MPRKLSQRDPIKAHQRKAAAARRVGENTQCAYCDETRPEALNTKSNPIACEECQRRRRGIMTMDNHHIAGKANSPITTSIPANDHQADLSNAQYDWPKETLENRDGSPLLRGAACVRGFADVVVYYAEQFLLWIAEMLELLSARLREEWGYKWWLKTDLKQFAPGEKSNGKS